MTLLTCCPCGDGTDASSPETGGRHWDCLGTGHLHEVGPSEYGGRECPSQEMLEDWIARQRHEARLAVSSMMADFAISYGWDLYQRWLEEWRRRRWLARHYLGSSVIDPSTMSKVLTSGV